MGNCPFSSCHLLVILTFLSSCHMCQDKILKDAPANSCSTSRCLAVAGEAVDSQECSVGALPPPPRSGSSAWAPTADTNHGKTQGLQWLGKAHPPLGIQTRHWHRPESILLCARAQPLPPSPRQCPAWLLLEATGVGVKRGVCEQCCKHRVSW